MQSGVKVTTLLAVKEAEEAEQRAKNWILPGPKGWRGTMRSGEGAFGEAASTDTTAVTRPAQNKPEEGEAVSGCPGISPSISTL